MGAVEKKVLLILYIMSITQVTSRGGIATVIHIGPKVRTPLAFSSLLP